MPVYRVEVENYLEKFEVEAADVVQASREVRGELRDAWGRLLWFRIEETRKLSEMEETKENAETQPEGNLGAVNRMGR